MLPPFTDLRSVQTLVEGDKLDLKYGAQDLSPHSSGAYTGDISGAFLAKLGCTYVAVGHSERREATRRPTQVVNAKVKAAYAHGLTPILCCGEGLDVRKEGAQVEHVVAQLREDLDGVTEEQAASIVVAYEPDLGDRHRRGRDPRRRAGGVRGDPHASSPSSTAATSPTASGSSTAASVKADNVAAIMAQEDVDGALVGGASIDAEEFASICRYRDHLATS